MHRTPRVILLLALAAGVGVFGSATAFAQDEQEPEPEVSSQPDQWERLLSVSVTGGWDTPFGVAGASVELKPIRYLGIYAGGGIGRSGARFAAGIHPQVPIENASLGLMLGVHGGQFDYDNIDQNFGIHRYWSMGFFAHAAVTFEYRWENGFFGRVMAGAEALLAPSQPTSCSNLSGTGTCDAASAGSLSLPIRGWVGLTLGYAFDFAYGAHL